MKILFQGDSITDCGRLDGDPLGYGYVREVSRKLDGHEVINKGISGNRTVDLIPRWTEDCIDINPDLLFILIGINDTWRRFDRDMPTTADEYYSNYKSLLERVKNETNARIVLLEPFITAVSIDHETIWRDDLDPKIHMVRRLSREFSTGFIPFDGLFAVWSTERAPKELAGDGVHPSEYGHKKMAETIVEYINMQC